MLFDTLDTKEKAEQFRIDRLKTIETGKIWSPMSDGPYCVVHWLPISKEALLSVDDFNSLEFSNFIRMERGGYIKEPNADGVRFYSTEKDEIQKVSMLTQEGHKGRYFWNMQMFHSGALEMAFAFSYWTKPERIKWIPQKLLLRNLRNVMSGFKGLMSNFNITAPIMVDVSLLRVLDYRFSADEHAEFVTGIPEPRRPSDKEQIILQGALMKNLGNMKEVERPIFDMLWRSFGYEKCEHYEENETYLFYGVSGHPYEYSLPQDIKAIPPVTGNYMLAAWYDNKWQVLYIDESKNLQNHLVNNRHEKMTDATVLAHPNSVRILYDANEWDEENRRNAEKDLIANYNPPLNVQNSTQNDKNTKQKAKQERIDSLVEWFHENYEDPAHRVPHDSGEGGYQWIYGGPYDAKEELTGRFPEEPEEIIEAAVEEIESDGLFDWAPVPKSEDYDEEPLDSSDLEDIATDLKSLIAGSPTSRMAPAFDFGENGLLHIVSPPDTQDVTSDDRVLEGLKAVKNDLKHALTGTNAHSSLLEAVEQYEKALPDEQISISFLYVQGVMLENAVDAIKRSIESEDLQPFSVDIERSINSVIELHGAYIMSNEKGKALVEASRAYQQSSQQIKESGVAVEKFDNLVTNDAILFGEDVKEYIAGVAQNMGKGPHSERSNQVVMVTLISLVSAIGVNIVSTAFEASVPGTLLRTSGTNIIDASWLFLSNAIPLLKVIAAPVGSDVSWIEKLSDLVNHFRDLYSLRY